MVTSGNLEVVSVNLGGTDCTQVSASVNIAVLCEQTRPMVPRSPQPRLPCRLGELAELLQAHRSPGGRARWCLYQGPW
jgi:hypothetical protein